MTKDEAYELFKEIQEEYKTVKSPKYKNIASDRIEELYSTLLKINPFLNDSMHYAKVVNAISQVKKRQSWSKSLWLNISERGINKAIMPVAKRYMKDANLPFEWDDSKTGHLCSVNGYWDEKNFMVADVIGYFFLLREGGDRLPKTMTAIFDNITKVSNREQDLKDNPTSPYNDADKNINDYYQAAQHKVAFTDQQFKKFTGTAMTSDAIKDLLHKTSSVEFKLAFPMRFDDKLNPHEERYTMNIFSRLFEFGYIDEKVRSDRSVKSRKYFVFFNTILGEMFVHNLLMKNYDYIDNSFYKLPITAQLLYRKFLQHNDYPVAYLNLNTIVSELNLQDKNPTNLRKTVEDSALKSLKDYGYIKSFTVVKGLQGRKYKIIK